MNPTLHPADPQQAMSRPVLQPTPAQRARARADLAGIADPQIRTQFALGYLRSCLADASRENTGPIATDALARSLAMLLELDAIERQTSRFFYDREDSTEGPTAVPEGVECYRVGRWPR